jgi:hypothetical protein
VTPFLARNAKFADGAFAKRSVGGVCARVGRLSSELRNGAEAGGRRVLSLFSAFWTHDDDDDDRDARKRKRKQT